jgi:uncharacterized sporulation protein YeaH/YhbH (DUF444 family)
VTGIVTHGGKFPQGKEKIINLTAIAIYVDHQRHFQQLKNVQEHHHVHDGSPSRTGTTRVSSVYKLLSQSLYFYWSLNCFFEEASDGENEDSDIIAGFQEIMDKD